MYCPKCGAPNKDGVRFCSSCDGELAVSQTGYSETNQNAGQNQQPEPLNQQPAQGYQAQGSEYQPQGPGYQAQGPGYQAQGPGYPAQGPGYQAQGLGYQPQGPGYQPQGQPQAGPQGPGYQPQGPGYQNQQPFYQSDAEKNKVIAIIAYFIFFIPLLAAKDSPFAKYHANQGFIIFVFAVGINIIFGIITALLLPAFIFSLGALGILGIITTISTILNLGILVLMILGIVNAAKGEMKPMPVIGNMFTAFK